MTKNTIADGVAENHDGSKEVASRSDTDTDSDGEGHELRRMLTPENDGSTAIHAGSTRTHLTEGDSFTFSGCEPENGNSIHCRDGKYFAVHFENCTLGNTNLAGCRLHNVVFTDCTFYGDTAWSDITLKNVQFINCEFDDFKWQNDWREDEVFIDRKFIRTTEMNEVFPSRPKGTDKTPDRIEGTGDPSDENEGDNDETRAMGDQAQGENGATDDNAEKRRRADAEKAQRAELLRFEKGEDEDDATLVKKTPLKFDVASENCQLLGGLTSVIFNGGFYDRVSFKDCRRDGLELIGCGFINTKFINCVFRNTKWTNIYMKDVIVEDCVFDEYTWMNDSVTANHLGGLNQIARESRGSARPSGIVDIEFKLFDASIAGDCN